MANFHLQLFLWKDWSAVASFLVFFLALARVWWIVDLVHPSCCVAFIGCIICSVILLCCCCREVEIISAIVTSIMGLAV
jgi:hypothetical protein